MGAAFHNGSSETVVSTPRVFMDAVERSFGPMDYDLAANAENAKAELWLGPGSPIAEDTLTTTLHALNGNLWCNPPYNEIRLWAEKMARTGTNPRFDGTILFLVPASVGSRWFAEWVLPYSSVYALTGRLTFEGHNSPYPKDLILAVYGHGNTHGRFRTWDWRKLLTSSPQTKGW